MPEIRSGFVTALYLFDVARSIDLDVIMTELGERAARARLGDKTAGPSRSRYVQPPLLVDGQALDCGDLDGFAVRVKFYDYGVVSLTLTRPFSGSWAELVSLGQTLIENEPLENHATHACQRIVDWVGPALVGRHASFLSEDYLVFAVTACDPPVTSDEMIAQPAARMASIARSPSPGARSTARQPSAITWTPRPSARASSAVNFTQ